MKTNNIPLTLTVVALLLDSLGLGAQTFNLIHSFADAFPNQDAPMGGVAVSGDMLYGTISQGPSPGHGAVFSLSAHIGAYKILHPFTAATTDGSSPQGALTLSGIALYGTTAIRRRNRIWDRVLYEHKRRRVFRAFCISFGAPSFNSSIHANTNTDRF